MTPQELKNSILQLAIQGKLVEQRPEEGTARELFVQIQAEKQRLIEAGKIKKEKPLPEIAEDEKPFEIPESWMWVRLGDITSKLTDGSHNPPPNMGKGVPVISAKNVKNGIITLENVDRFTDDDGFKKENPRTNIIKDDIIMGIIGGSIGNVAVYTHDVKVIAQRSIAIMRFLISTTFSKILLESPLIQNRLITSTSGSAQGGVYLGTLKNLPIPLPPLAEQKRIVAKIEELLPYIDRYEQAWSKLEQLNSRFPEDMKKALLQYAIQGKLVEQRPEEGTGEELFAQIQAEKQRLIQAGKIKKEKPLPEITEDEVPFEIPESWKWVRWGTLSESIQYGYNAPAQSFGRIKMVRISDIQDGKVIWESVPFCNIHETEIAEYILKKNDILFARTGGTVGKSYLVKDVPEESIYAGYLIRTRYSKSLCPEYMKYFMESALYWTQLKNGTIATAQPNCNGKTLAKMLLPLPPLAEQKRIVEKLEQLLPLCDRLKKQIV